MKFLIKFFPFVPFNCSQPSLGRRFQLIMSIFIVLVFIATMVFHLCTATHTFFHFATFHFPDICVDISRFFFCFDLLIFFNILLSIKWNSTRQSDQFSCVYLSKSSWIVPNSILSRFFWFSFRLKKVISWNQFIYNKTFYTKTLSQWNDFPLKI